MPLYVDIHREMHGVSPEAVRADHICDLEAQEKYGVNYIKYWHDERRGTVVCLVEAPSAEAARNCHVHAHGNAADEIIEVEAQILAAFLGDQPTDAVGAVVQSNKFDGAFRTIMFTDIVGSTALHEELGDEEVLRRLGIHNEIVRRNLSEFRGREVRHTGDGFLATFIDASAGVECARRIQDSFRDLAQDRPGDALAVRIGLGAGEPVNAHNDIYGAAVNLAARVCDLAGAAEIVVASVVRDLCIGKKIDFEDRGEVNLKGFANPVRVYAVVR